MLGLSGALQTTFLLYQLLLIGLCQWRNQRETRRLEGGEGTCSFLGGLQLLPVLWAAGQPCLFILAEGRLNPVPVQEQPHCTFSETPTPAHWYSSCRALGPSSNFFLSSAPLGEEATSHSGYCYDFLVPPFYLSVTKLTTLLYLLNSFFYITFSLLSHWHGFCLLTRLWGIQKFFHVVNKKTGIRVG